MSTQNFTITYNTIKSQALPLKQVGKTGFEPATPWSQTMCSTKLSYFPILQDNAPERSRTPNLLIRSQTLYPIELRAPANNAIQCITQTIFLQVYRVRSRGLEPPRGCPH